MHSKADIKQYKKKYYFWKKGKCQQAVKQQKKNAKKYEDEKCLLDVTIIDFLVTYIHQVHKYKCCSQLLINLIFKDF